MFFLKKEPKIFYRASRQKSTQIVSLHDTSRVSRHFNRRLETRRFAVSTIDTIKAKRLHSVVANRGFFVYKHENNIALNIRRILIQNLLDIYGQFAFLRSKMES